MRTARAASATAQRRHLFSVIYSPVSDPEKKLWGLARRRQFLVPSWKGWLIILLVAGPLMVLGTRGLHSFLAMNDPLPGGVMVVEGWAADYSLSNAVAEFRHQHYDKMYVTGGPIEWGAPLAEYKTYAERGAAILVKMGLSSNEVQAVPAPFVAQDRTYMSAITLRHWWQEHGQAPTKVHLMTEGLHSRRSRLLFKRALGKDVAVGVTAIPGRDYDPAHWWRYSAGVRGVIGEAVAYFYAAVLFHPGKQE